MDGISTLTDLKAKLDQQTTAGNLVLTSENSAAEKLTQFLYSLPAGQISITGAAVTLNGSGDKLTISGAVDEQWAIRGIGANGVHINRLTVEYTKPATSFEVRLKLEGNVQVGERAVSVSGVLGSDNQLDFTLPTRPTDSISLPAVANFISGNKLGSYLPVGVDFLGMVPLTSLEFSFGYTRAAVTQFSFTSDINAEWKIADSFASLKIVGITLNTKCYFTRQSGYRETLSGNIHGTLNLGQDFEVRLALQSQDDWEIEVLPADGNILPGLSALAGMIGGDALKNDIQTGLRNLKLDAISIDGVSLRVVQRKGLQSISVRGHITVDGIVFYIFTVLPNFTFHGDLSPSTPINLKTLIGKHFAGAEAFPEIALTRLGISAQPSAGQYEFYASITSDWQIRVGSVAIGVKEFNFDIVKQPNGITGLIESKFVIGDAEFDVIASHPETGAGWQFDGSTGPGQRLPIGKLVESLAGLFGEDIKEKLPKAVADLVIENLHVSFNTESKNFTYACESRFPVDANANVTLMVTIVLTSNKDSYEKNFVAHIEVDVASLPAPLHFDLKFVEEKDQGKTLDLFVATYSHTGGEQKLNLGDLIRSVVPYLPPPDWTHALDGISIDLKDALFAFSKNGEDKKFLFGLDIGAEFSLAKLPLVGKDFPPERTVGIENLQALIASKPFSAAEVKKLNDLIPTGVTKLPDKSKSAGARGESQDDAQTIALKQGFNVGATLKLGDAKQNLSLPVVASATSQKDDTTDSTSAQNAQATTTADNATWFKIQKSLGPIHLEQVGMQYRDAAVWFLLDAALGAAGLTLSLNGLSAGSPINEFRPRFKLRGLSVDYRNEALEIGGAFLKTNEKEYAGAAVLKVKQLTISALGMYREMDDGKPSMFIYAVLDYPIGGPSFFFVTGLAAGFGYNRALKMPAIDRVANFSLVENARGGAGMPKDIAAELQKMKGDITPAAGQHFLAIGLKFTSFKVVDSFALLTVSFGNHFEMNLLGLSTLVAPANAGNGTPPVAEAQLALKASFQPDKGFLGVQAQLTSNSYLLSKDCHLTGGFAFFSWFAGSGHDGDFVLTLGGYHPRFSKFAHYPTVPRLGFNWQVTPELSLKGDAYFALTASALMAGGHLEADWRSGPVHAWFKLGADFLIAWKPYHYHIDAYIDMGAEVTFEFFGTQHITIDVGADLHIWGPEFTGEATIHLWIISFNISFGVGARQKPSKIGWDEFRSSFLPENRETTRQAVKKYDVLSLAVTGGLIGKEPQGKADYLGIVDPKRFSLAINTLIPVNDAKYVYKSPDGKDDKKPIETGPRSFTKCGIAPLDVKAKALNSTQTITILCNGAAVGENTFKYRPILKKVPVALWGESMSPELNGNQFVENALCGFEIQVAAEPAAGGSVETEQAKLQAEHSGKQLSCRWESAEPFVAKEFKTEKDRKDELQKAFEDGATGRQTMLASLGFTEEEIKKIGLSKTHTKDFLIAPQIEKV
jgi:hypothetical protein